MDIRTILVCLFFINFFLGIVIYVLKKSYQNFKEVGHWMASFFLISIGYFLISLRSIIPDFYSIIIANVFILSAGIMRVTGFHQFFKLKRKNLQIILLGVVLPAFTAIMLFLTYFHNSLYVRTVFIGIVYSGLSIYLGSIVLYQKPVKEAFIYKFTAATFFLFAGIFILRVLCWILFPSLRSFFNHSFINYLQFFASVMIDICWAILYFTIYNHHISLQLIDSEKKYRSIFEKNKSNILLINPLTGDILDANPSVSNFYGFPREQLVKMNISEINLLSQEEVRKELITAKNEKNNFWVSKHRKASGIICDVEVFSTPFRYQGQDMLHCIVHDISARKKNESDLRKLSKAIESSQASVVITDIHGHIEYANPYFTQLTGYEPIEFLGKKTNFLNSGHHSSMFYKELWETILSGKTWEGEFHNRKKNGDLYWENAIISPIKNSNDEICNFVAVKNDITEAKRITSELIVAKEKAEESDRLKSAFLQNMSHEVRTPMNAIMGFSDLLLETAKEDPKISSYVGIINRKCEDLLDVMNDIMEISRIESGQMPLKMEECHVQSIFEELSLYFENLQTKNPKPQISFHLQILDLPSELTLYTEKSKLKQIFVNLINNAHKFTDSGKITGGCMLDKNQNFVFFISDTGIGIPIEKQQMIFERFTQVDHGNFRFYGGTGLGLSIVKGLIDLLGGEIWIESDPGKGSTFYFTVAYKKKS